MKFCKDCRWYREHLASGGVSAYCDSPQTPMVTDMVTGVAYRANTDPHRNRYFGDLCGQHAAWFAPKQPPNDRPEFQPGGIFTDHLTEVAEKLIKGIGAQPNT